MFTIHTLIVNLGFKQALNSHRSIHRGRIWCKAFSKTVLSSNRRHSRTHICCEAFSKHARNLFVVIPGHTCVVKPFLKTHYTQIVSLAGHTCVVKLFLKMRYTQIVSLAGHTFGVTLAWTSITIKQFWFPYANLLGCHYQTPYIQIFVCLWTHICC